MAGLSTLGMIGTVGSAASTGLGILGALSSGRQQAKSAEASAAVAENNQKLAEEQASAQRRQGYEAMISKRQEVGKLIGKQRAAAGASGATVDEGSTLDTNMATAAQGEIDALTLYQRGLDAAYNSELQAWNYGQQAAAYSAQAKSAKTAGWLGAATAAVGGISSMSNIWGKSWAWADDAASGGNPIISSPWADAFSGKKKLTARDFRY